jgi:signal transduction histidine kinase
VFATSVLINTIPLGVPSEVTISDVAGLVAIVVIQTLAIGGGTVVGVKMTEQNEERRKALADLEAAMAENEALQAQLVTQAREAGIHDERQRMAREIHDTLAQGLTGILTQLQAAEQAAGEPERWLRHLTNATQLARESLSEARRSVGAMRPEVLESAHLPAAVGDVVEHWTRLHGIPVEVTTTGNARPLHPEVEVALLRTAQEALTNVAKHANATHVWLTLSYMEDVVTLDVRDDGSGFEPGSAASDNGGYGLTGMRHRVGRLAGTLEIESEPGAGTAISASLPAIPAGTGG